MDFLTNFYLKNYKYDLINKFFYLDTKNLPQIKHITLNFKCDKSELKHITSSLLAIELMTHQKAFLTTAKKPNIILKIRKGYPIGCKITLKKKKMIGFLIRIILKITPKLKNLKDLKLKKTLQNDMFSYEFHDAFIFSELKSNYYLFNTLPKLTINVMTTSKKKEELIYILQLIKINYFLK